jgi:hypothetical protein
MILVRSVSRDVCDASPKHFFILKTNPFSSFQINRYNAIDLSVRTLPSFLSGEKLLNWLSRKMFKKIGDGNWYTEKCFVPREIHCPYLF